MFKAVAQDSCGTCMGQGSSLDGNVSLFEFFRVVWSGGEATYVCGENLPRTSFLAVAP